MVRKLARIIVTTFFREVTLQGREHLPKDSPVIFTPNHPNGLLDPMLLYCLPSSIRLRFVAKAPLFKIPMFGSILRSAGAIPVQRRFEASGEVDYSAFFSACVEALSHRDSLVIFPEGRSLAQAYLAPLRTGPARLFFLAREKGIRPQIIPVGLNYERGYTFRTTVLVSIATPIDTKRFESMYAAMPKEAVRDLTAEIATTLQNHVLQAETYRDKELMVLLERLYGRNKGSDFGPDRFSRLKDFERGLVRLRQSCPEEIDRLRLLLARYQRLTSTFGVEDVRRNSQRRSGLSLLAGFSGWILASPGCILNYIPYKLTDVLIRLTRRDESNQATFKIIYSLFLFPFFYILEGVAIRHFLGTVPAILFALFIVPVSYFTVSFLEWWEREYGGTVSARVSKPLEQLQRRIIAEVQTLATRPELSNP